MKYNLIVEETRKSRCESVLDNIKKQLKEINDTFVKKLCENTFTPDNAYHIDIIMNINKI